MGITRDQIVFTVRIEPEDLQVEDSFASGDAALDRELCEGIHKRLRDGDVWAWCCVCVTGSIEYTNEDGNGGTPHESLSLDEYLGAAPTKTKRTLGGLAVTSTICVTASSTGSMRWDVRLSRGR